MWNKQCIELVIIHIIHDALSTQHKKCKHLSLLENLELIQLRQTEIRLQNICKKVVYFQDLDKRTCM
jgi:hypothetical protein